MLLFVVENALSYKFYPNDYLRKMKNKPESFLIQSNSFLSAIIAMMENKKSFPERDKAFRKTKVKKHTICIKHFKVSRRKMNSNFSTSVPESSVSCECEIIFEGIFISLNRRAFFLPPHFHDTTIFILFFLSLFLFSPRLHWYRWSRDYVIT